MIYDFLHLDFSMSSGGLLSAFPLSKLQPADWLGFAPGLFITGVSNIRQLTDSVTKCLA